MPRVRIASAPIAAAVAIPASTPIAIPAHHGAPKRETAMPHRYAPAPNRAECPNESRPVKPISKLKAQAKSAKHNNFIRKTGYPTKGAFEPFAANVTMGRLPNGSLEGPGEMEAAQTCDRRQVIKREVAFQVSLDMVKHAGQPASIKPLPHGAGRRQRR